MSMPRRPSEVLRDAEVAIEAAGALQRLADAIAARAEEIRAAAASELDAVGLRGVLANLEGSPSSGDPAATDMASKAFQSVIEGLSAGDIVKAGVGAFAGDSPDEDEEPFVLFDVQVPVRCKAEADDVVEAAKRAANGGDVEQPYLRFRGRHIWKRRLYENALASMGTERREAPAPSDTPVAAAVAGGPVSRQSELGLGTEDNLRLAPISGPRRGSGPKPVPPAGKLRSKGTNLGGEMHFEASDKVLQMVAAQRGKT